MQRREGEGVGDVVLVDELEAGIEPRDIGDDSPAEQPSERRVGLRAEDVREPQLRHEDVRVVVGEVAHDGGDLEQ